MNRRTSKEILAASREAILAVHRQITESENWPGVPFLTKFLLESYSIELPREAFFLYPNLMPGHPDRSETMATARDAAVFRLWERSKVVYAMDELLIQYLSESHPTSIPTVILRNVPHRDPFILLPQADPDDPDTTYYRQHVGLPVGAFIFGRYNQARQMCSTADARREDLGAMFVGTIERDGRPDLQIVRCFIPLSGDTFTVGNAVNQAVERFNFTADLQGTREDLERWLRRYVTQLMNSLVYVCTDQPDVEASDPRLNQAGKAKKSRSGRRRPDDIGTLVKLGFRLGPALHEARRRWERSQTPSGSPGTDRTVRPHQKVGHYRTYWTGRGGTVPLLKWIKPFWVNQDLVTGKEPRTVTVRPVRKRSGELEARGGMATRPQ